MRRLGRLGNHKAAIFVIVMGLVLLGCHIVPAHAQREDYPIGMNLVYITNVFFQYAPAIPEYEIKYDFIRWIDEDSLHVEYEQDSMMCNQSFLDVRLPMPELPRLWLNVSTWELWDTIEMSGFLYRFVVIEDMFFGTLGTHECYRLEYILESDGFENATSLWYHSITGTLVEYLHSTAKTDGTWSWNYNSFVLDGNFHHFNPPTFSVPQPTTTTTIPPYTTTPSETTTPTTPTSYPPQQTTTTTSPTTGGYELPVGLNEVLTIGIAIELFVILLFVRTGIKSRM